MLDRKTTDETPIRGPEWSKAQLMRTSVRLETRDANGSMFGLQKHLNAFVDNIKKGVDAEAAVTVNKDKVSRFRRHSHSTPLSTTSSADGDDRPKKENSRALSQGQLDGTSSAKHGGAFAFLNARK